MFDLQLTSSWISVNQTDLILFEQTLCQTWLCQNRDCHSKDVYLFEYLTSSYQKCRLYYSIQIWSAVIHGLLQSVIYSLISELHYRMTGIEQLLFPFSIIDILLFSGVCYSIKIVLLVPCKSLLTNKIFAKSSNSCFSQAK